MYKIKYKCKVDRGAHRKQAFPPVCDTKHYFIILMKKNKTTDQITKRIFTNEDIGVHKPHS